MNITSCYSGNMNISIEECEGENDFISGKVAFERTEKMDKNCKNIRYIRKNVPLCDFYAVHF